MFRLNNAAVLPPWIRLAEAAGWSVVILLALWWFVAERIALRTTKADRSFSDHPPGLQEFPMEIVILRNDEEVGMDRGFAWFEDRLFHFNGAATSFVLSCSEFTTLKRPLIDMTGHPRNCIGLRHPAMRASLRLLPLGVWNHACFWLRFRRFLRESANRTASRQWPPLVSYVVEKVILERRSPEEVGAEAARTGAATGVIRG